MVHAAVRAGRTAGATVPGRIRRRRLDLTTTPGRLRLLLGGLVLLSLAWGALAAFTAVPVRDGGVERGAPCASR